MANSRYVLVDEDFQFEVLRQLKELKDLIGVTPAVPHVNEDLMDSADLLAYLKITRRTLHKYRVQMGLPSKKMENGKIYFRRAEVDAFINSFSQDQNSRP